ncbi:MAG: GNAT family N-acetyltransferase [Bacteroidota bacterium]
MKIEIKCFEELDTADLYGLLQLRSEVFVVEQNCVYQDMDGKDQQAIHILGKNQGKIVAYLRVFKSGDYFETTSIGRVVVAKPSRKKGHAKEIMNAAIACIEGDLKEKTITLSAQTYLVHFYVDLGFKKKGKEYLEDGIPHVKMVYG